MKILLDTHVLLWAAANPERLSDVARQLIERQDNTLYFSAVSLWEITIKSGLGRDDFQVDAPLLRRGLLNNGYYELAVNGEHALAVAMLPPIHRDPFDRMLIAQATLEGMRLLTADAAIAQYPGPIEKM